MGKARKHYHEDTKKHVSERKYPVLKLHRYFFLKMNLIDKNNSDNNNYLIPRHVTGINDCLEANGLSGISFAYRNAVSLVNKCLKSQQKIRAATKPG